MVKKVEKPETDDDDSAPEDVSFNASKNEITEAELKIKEQVDYLL
jgi:hypothetical protein